MPADAKHTRLGTIGAGSAWFLIVALAAYSSAFTIPLLMWCAFAVSIRSAWMKNPMRFWRSFLAVSLLAGVFLAIFVAPGDEALFLDGILMTKVLVWTVCFGAALLPLSLAATIHSIRMSRRSKSNP